MSLSRSNIGWMERRVRDLSAAESLWVHQNTDGNLLLITKKMEIVLFTYRVLFVKSLAISSLEGGW